MQGECSPSEKLLAKINYKNLTLADKWILSCFNKLIRETENNIENYELGRAAKDLYEFSWHKFADWYLEISKLQIKKPELKEQTIKVLYYILFGLLKLLHPFVPFVTEKIWLEFSKEKNNLLIVANWPKQENKFINQEAEKEFLKIQEEIIKTRKQSSPKKEQLSAFLKI